MLPLFLACSIAIDLDKVVEIDTGTTPTDSTTPAPEPCAISASPTEIELKHTTPMWFITVPACAAPIEATYPEWVCVKVYDEYVIIEWCPQGGTGDHAGESGTVVLTGVLRDTTDVVVSVAEDPRS